MIPHSKIVTIVVIRMSKLQVIAIMDFDYSRFNLRNFFEHADKMFQKLILKKRRKKCARQIDLLLQLIDFKIDWGN